jgi:hypothetical protein
MFKYISNRDKQLMRKDYETERSGTKAGTPQFTNDGSIQKFPMYIMYKIAIHYTCAWENESAEFPPRIFGK